MRLKLTGGDATRLNLAAFDGNNKTKAHCMRENGNRRKERENARVGETA